MSIFSNHFFFFSFFASNISLNNDKEREYKTISRQLPTKSIGLASPAHDMCNPWPPWHTPIRRRILSILSIYTSQSFAILASNRRKEATAKATNRILCRIFPTVSFLSKRKIVFLALFTLSMNFNDEKIRLELILTHTHTLVAHRGESVSKHRSGSPRYGLSTYTRTSPKQRKEERRNERRIESNRNKLRREKKTEGDYRENEQRRRCKDHTEHSV